MIVIKIPLECKPKKNSQRIIVNQRTQKPMIIQSQQYLEFEEACFYYLKNYIGLEIDEPINLECTFYVKDRRKRDLTNLLNAIQDILVKYKVIKDDNYNIVNSVDGSRIIYEKNKSEIIIKITKKP